MNSIPGNEMNVFLIQTATQLLNAIEAKHFFDLRNCHLIVFLPEEYPREAYRDIVNKEEWKSVYYLPTTIKTENPFLNSLKYSSIERIRGYFSTYELFILRRKLDSITESIGKVEKIFLGNYWIPYMRHFVHRVRPQQIFLLDDGTATILINKKRKEKLSTKGHWSLKAIKEKLIDRAIGLLTAEAQKVTFFTTYDLEFAPGDEVMKNNYRYLKTLAEKAKTTDEIFFLGQTLIDVGLSDKDYLEHLEKVHSYYKGEPFIYIPHKSEHADRVGTIREKMGIIVRKFNAPIEFQLAMSGSIPSVLASFCSSALETCRVIFGDRLKIDVFYINSEYFTMKRDFIKDIYSYYESRANPNFKIVRLSSDKTK